MNRKRWTFKIRYIINFIAYFLEKKLNWIKLGKKDKTETDQETKLKCRMTILNVYNTYKKAKILKKGIHTEPDKKTQEIEEYIFKFIESESEFFKCIDYLADFENLILSTKKSSTTSIFSKGDYSKIHLNFVILQNNFQKCEKLFQEKLNNVDSTDYTDLVILYLMQLS